VDPDLIDSGRTARRDSVVLTKIALPMSAPALVTGAGTVFLLSLLDYSVPSLFQVNVYPLEVFADYSATNRPERALLLTLPMLLIAVGAAAGLLRSLRALAVRTTAAGRRWSPPPQWPLALVTLQWVALALLGLQVLVPIGVLLAQSGGPSGVASSLGAAWGDIRSSVWTAAVASGLSALVGLGLARRLGKEATGRGWWLLVMAPLAIPASLAGIGFVVVTAPISGVLGSALAAGPALVLFARFVPLSALVLLAQMRRLDPLLFECARISEPSAWRRALLIEAPLLSAGLLAAGGLTFALSLGELGATLLAVPPGMGALSIRIYNYLHYGASETVAGLCLALEACVLATALASLGLAGRWNRRIASGETR
jgi:iron(III) transport system permease protein